MLITWFIEPTIGSFKPNWKAGEDIINSYTQTPPDADYLGDDLKEVKNILLSQLAEVKGAYEEGSRELTDIVIGPYTIYVTGGMSWGDPPTDLFNYISILNTLFILDACGFNKVIDYKLILEKILTHKEVLPLLVGLNPDLDKMISSALSTKSKRKKNAKK